MPLPSGLGFVIFNKKIGENRRHPRQTRVQIFIQFNNNYPQNFSPKPTTTFSEFRKLRP
jgi:hypothetical protein